jgi:glycosyltransferase involved in cell wall biosynthesis
MTVKEKNLEPLMISVVTIVYNGVDEIEKTIKSVLAQSYGNIEYIIIDGGSNDGTLEIIKKYDRLVTNWLSEKDDGIYDAMNKGNEIANGDYVIFLNSGDLFTDDNVVDSIFSNINGEVFSLVTGKTGIFFNNRNLGIDSTLPKDRENLGSVSFSHQATFINKSVYKKISYNTTFSISADKEYWYRVKKTRNFSVKFCDKNISSFELGGVSNNHKNVLNRRLEDFFIEYKHEGVNFMKLTKMYLLTIATFILTINESFYYRNIYVFINKFKNMKNY